MEKKNILGILLPLIIVSIVIWITQKGFFQKKYSTFGKKGI